MSTLENYVINQVGDSQYEVSLKLNLTNPTPIPTPVPTPIGNSYNIINVLTFGAKGDGITDDRLAFQNAFNSLKNGDTILIPNCDSYYKIINAIGSGSTLVAQRANAVTNNLLSPITCNKNNITVILEGNVKETSILTNLFEFTGDKVKVVFNGGSVSGVGGSDDVGFLDTNSEDVTQQWKPSLIKLTGRNSRIYDAYIIDPPAVGIHITNKSNRIINPIIEGGRVVHGNGTVSFGILVENTAPFTKITGANSIKNSKGGMVYDCIFNIASDVNLCNNLVEDVHEHAIYNYGNRATICNNNTDCPDAIAAIIQSFADYCVIDYNVMKHAKFGGIAVQRGKSTSVCNNKVYDAGGAVISYRTFYADDINYVVEDLKMDNNQVYLNPLYNRGSGIDIRPTYNAKNISACSNTVYNANKYGLSYNAGVIVFTITDKCKVSNSKFESNQIFNSEGYSMQLHRVESSKINNNLIKNGNASNASEAIGINLKLCVGNEIDDNFIEDNRTTHLMTFGIYEDDDCSNNKITNNTSLGMLEATPYRFVQNNTTERYGNKKKLLPLTGVVTMSNTPSQNFTSADSIGIDGIMYGAKILLRPMNKSAGLLQGSSKHVVCSAIDGAGFMQLQTSDSSYTGTTSAIFMWEAIQ